MEEEKKKKLIFFILGGLGLYLLSTGFSYAAFRYLGKKDEQDLISPVPIEEGRARIGLDAPKTETCSLIGEMFTKAERDIWEKRRPLGIMIENHLDSRPQSGLSYADVIYEAVAEGGIARFLAVYYCRAAAQDVLVGPVRSARTYYLDWISEYGQWPLYAHVGGANDFDGRGNTHLKARALEQIQDYGWRLYNDLDQSSIGFPTYWRDYERLGRPVATEHTVYASTDRLWEVAEKRGLTQTDKEGKRWNEEFTPWQFKEEETEENRGEVGKIEFSFWRNQPAYEVRWDYDRVQNSYSRVNGDQSHKDLVTDGQLAAKVVIVQFVKETGPVDNNKHLLYETIDNGQALVFQDGGVVEATWQKKSKTDRTVFLDGAGKEIAFNPGQIWIEIIPIGNEVSY